MKKTKNFKKCANLNKTIILKNSQLKSYLTTPLHKPIKSSKYIRIKNNKMNLKAINFNNPQFEN
jgi:hypothetical protein